MKKHNFNAGPSILRGRGHRECGQGDSRLQRIGSFAAFDLAPDEGFRRRDGRGRRCFSANCSHIPDNYKIIYLGGGASTHFYRSSRQLPGQEGRLREYGCLGQEGHQGGETLRRSGGRWLRPRTGTSPIFPRGSPFPPTWTMCISPRTIRSTARSTTRTSRFARAPDRRHVFGHPLAARCDVIEVRHDLRRCAEEPGSRGRGVRHHPRGYAGQDRPRPADDDVVTGPMSSNNSMFNTPPVFPIYVLKETLKWLKSIGGVDRNLPPQQGEGRAALRRDRPQPALPRYGREGGPFADEHLLRDGRGLRGAGSRVYGVRQEPRHGRHQGPPSGGRLPRVVLQRPARRRASRRWWPACRSSPRRIRNSSDVSDASSR